MRLEEKTYKYRNARSYHNKVSLHQMAIFGGPRSPPEDMTYTLKNLPYCWKAIFKKDLTSRGIFDNF